VDLSKFKISRPLAISHQSSVYYLVVSRLEPYKRVDIIVDAFNKLGYNLKIVGKGSNERRLKRKAKENIEFLGQDLTDDELLRYYQNCLALVFAGREDFGLVSLEAQASGVPVIAFKGGGIKETIIEEKTGVFFKKQNAQSLINAVKKFKKMKFDAGECRKNAEKFSKEIFIKRFKEEVEQQWQKHKMLGQK
jgi:glycosyltransferase involved in cell wall biosynthesis